MKIIGFEDKHKQTIDTYSVHWASGIEADFTYDFEMRHAVEVFLYTDRGQKILSLMGDDFNWFHAMKYISEEFWAEHGFQFIKTPGGVHDKVFNGYESLEIPLDSIEDEIFMFNRSIERILLSYEKLEDLCEALDTCFDLWDLGYSDIRTQRNYILLSEFKAIDLWYQHKEAWKAAKEKKLALR